VSKTARNVPASRARVKQSKQNYVFWAAAAGPAQKHFVNPVQASRGFLGSCHSSQTGHRQAYPGQNMEADGQGRQVVSAAENESEKLAPLHPRHPARHVPKAETHLLQI